ncbi:hypothetical protein ABZT17_44485 [Streptomyces sp. NPDC005648]|uniref:hypothetical protein n=1 Tax=Streptomyces sp. NPDC005648 TaxID=3157044 RepID=UPI0033A1848B
MRLRLQEFRPRTGPHEHRVVQPRHPLRHTSLTAPDPVGLLLGDHDGLNHLAGLFSFAAYSRHTIVHVPLRDGVPPDEGWGERVDLVLAHRTLGLRAAQWPELRRKLTRGMSTRGTPTRGTPTRGTPTRGTPTRGAPLTVHTDEARTARDAESSSARRSHVNARDKLRHATHARTLFLFGDQEVFAQLATDFAYAAGWGPREKRVAEGHMAFMTALILPEPRGSGGHPLEVDICFKAYPPYAHFRRPGEPAIRRRRSATSP